MFKRITSICLATISLCLLLLTAAVTDMKEELSNNNRHTVGLNETARIFSKAINILAEETGVKIQVTPVVMVE